MKKFCALASALLLICALIQAQDSSRIALINISPHDENASKLCDLLSACLMENKKLEVLEREQIQKVLREQEIDLSNSKSALKAGQILRTELLIALQKIPESKNAIRLIGFDVKHGIRILDLKLPTQEKPFTKSAIEAINKAIALSKEKNPKIYSVPPLMSQELLFKYDKYQDLVAAYLRKELLRRGVFVIEFEEAKRIFDELQTSKGKDKIDLPEVIILSGEFQVEKDKPETTIKSTVKEISSNGTLKKSIAETILASNIPGGVSRIVDKLLTQKDSQCSTKKTFDKEFKSLLTRAKKHLAAASFEQARQETQVALLFAPSSAEARKILCFSCMGIIEKNKNKSFTANSLRSLYFQYLENLEWLAKNNISFSGKLLDERQLVYKIPQKPKTTYRMFLAKLKALCEHIIKNYPPNAHPAISAKKIYPAIIRRLYYPESKRIKAINQFIIKCGNALANDDHILNCYFNGRNGDIEIGMDKKFADQLLHLLQEPNLTPAIKALALKDLRQMNKSLKARGATPVNEPSAPFSGYAEKLKSFERPPPKSLQSKNEKELWDIAQKAYKNGNPNECRLDLETILEKTGNLSPEKDRLLFTAYNNIRKHISNTGLNSEETQLIMILYSEKTLQRLQELYNKNTSLKDRLPSVQRGKSLSDTMGELLSPQIQQKSRNALSEDVKTKLLEHNLKVRKFHENICQSLSPNRHKFLRPYLTATNKAYANTFWIIENNDEERLKRLKESFQKTKMALSAKNLFYFCVLAKNGQEFLQYLSTDKKFGKEIKELTASKGAMYKLSLAPPGKKTAKQATLPGYIAIEDIKDFSIAPNDAKRKICDLIDCGKYGEAIFFPSQVYFHRPHSDVIPIIKDTKHIEKITDAIWSGKYLWIAAICKNTGEKENCSRGKIYCWNPLTETSKEWGQKEGVIMEFLKEPPPKTKNNKKYYRTDKDSFVRSYVDSYSTIRLFPYKDKVFAFGAYFPPDTSDMLNAASQIERKWIGELSQNSTKMKMIINAKGNDKSKKALMNVDFWEKLAFVAQEKGNDIIRYYGGEGFGLSLNPKNLKTTEAPRITNGSNRCIPIGNGKKIDNILNLKSGIRIIKAKNTTDSCWNFKGEPPPLNPFTNKIKTNIFKYKGRIFYDRENLYLIDLKNLEFHLILDKEKSTLANCNMFASKFWGILAHNASKGKFYKIGINIEEALKGK